MCPREQLYGVLVPASSYAVTSHRDRCVLQLGGRQLVVFDGLSLSLFRVLHLVSGLCLNFSHLFVAFYLFLWTQAAFKQRTSNIPTIWFGSKCGVLRVLCTAACHAGTLFRVQNASRDEKNGYAAAGSLCEGRCALVEVSPLAKSNEKLLLDAR